MQKVIKSRFSKLLVRLSLERLFHSSLQLRR
jgi:hypothetical protein